MTTIAEENRKTLRQAMTVRCGFSESTEEPTSITPFGHNVEYEGIANLDVTDRPQRIMDLSGDGFLNDGTAGPLATYTDSLNYGYMSADKAKPDGTFATSFGVVVAAANAWKYVTLELRHEDGTTEVKQFTPAWAGGQARIEITEWVPGERCYISGVYLGKTWLWDNSTLIDVSLDLRGVNTEIGGELEISSIEIQAYEQTDYTDILGLIPVGAQIWYRAGYSGDMSERRKFYLSEPAEWEGNVLTVRGQDATMLLENEMVDWEWYIVDAGEDIPDYIGYRVRAALDGIVTYGERGELPVIQSGSGQNLYFESFAPRTIISFYTDIFRDPNYARLTYVDAGIPMLTYGDIVTSYTIYADEIEDIKATAEQNINNAQINVATYSGASAFEEYETIDAVANRTYFITVDEPVVDSRLTPEPKSSTWIGNSTVKFVAKYTQTYTFEVKKLDTVLTDGNNPYSYMNAENGTSYIYDNIMPWFAIPGGSITKKCVPQLLSRSNIVYEIKYRGNPHIQPRDIIRVEIVRWVDALKTIDGLYPETDLYPSESLYPDATYKKTRKMETEWVKMTVDSLTLAHNGGGLTSTIRARKGVV